MALFDDAGMILVSDGYGTTSHDWQPAERSDRSPPQDRVSPPAITERWAGLQSPQGSPSPGQIQSRQSNPSQSNPSQISPERYFRRKDQLVIQQGELWKIEQGFVKALTWDEQGCILTLGIWGPGDFVGLPLGNITPYEILCMSPVRAKLHQCPTGYPHEFLQQQAQQSQELLSLFRCRCLENRLLDSLWWLASRFGNAAPRGRFTGITLTHQELADLVGSTRVTMTRMLKQLEESDKLERINRQFFLKETRHTSKRRIDCL